MRGRKNKELVAPTDAFDAHRDEDGHIRRMVKSNGRKLSHKEKRKQERNAKKQKNQKQQTMNEKKGKKRTHEDAEQDWFNDETLMQPKKKQKEEDYESDNSDDSDIVDDLPHDKKTKGNVVIDDKFLKEMNNNETPDDRIMRALERKLGIAKKKRKQEKKAREAKEKNANSGAALKEFVEQKRAQKQQREEDDEDEVEEENEDDDEGTMDADPDGDVPVNDYEDDLSDGFYDGKGDILDDLTSLLDFTKPSTLDKEFKQIKKEDEKDEEESDQDDEQSEEEEQVSDDDVDLVEEVSDEQVEVASEDEIPIEEKIEEKPQTSTKDGKYLPPHLRKRNDAFFEFQQKLRGLMNRLSLINFVSITNEAIELYNKSSKNDFHTTLCDTALDAACNTVNMTSDFMLVYAAFIVALHNVVGMEVGAHFAEQLIKRFEAVRTDRQKGTNVLLLMCHVYNLGLVFCGLIYDIIRLFCNDFSELNIELLFKLLKTCGFQLRADDPSSLKDIIQVIQEKAAELKGDSNKRISFMLEMIYDLKNNKKRKSDEDSLEQYKSLKKTIKEIQSQHRVSGENTLRISYKDGLNSARMGRWWLVGSAWAGPSNEEEKVLDKKDNISNVLKDIKVEDQIRLEKLAKEQRMTTELRKTIFYILMSSEDFVDAFQKLAKLGIKKNDREIVRVIVHCCCQEKTFNQYYSLLSQRVCAAIGKTGNRTFQYTFYEHFKELSTYKMRKITNLSKLLSILVETGTLSLAMLKIIDFNHLDSTQEIVFFRLFFMHLLLDLDENECTKIFMRLAKVNHCEELKESLVLFLFQFVDKSFRKEFVSGLLAVRDINKKNDKVWLLEQEEKLKDQAKAMRKILKIEFERDDDREEDGLE
jgi:nucleolar MIF4G domain-containing protein 1